MTIDEVNHQKSECIWDVCVLEGCDALVDNQSIGKVFRAFWAHLVIAHTAHESQNTEASPADSSGALWCRLMTVWRRSITLGTSGAVGRHILERFEGPVLLEALCKMHGVLRLEVVAA